MSKILGLDLGTNSIGWAIIDNSSNKIIDCGVRIFPNLLNNERHLARQQRRTENKIVQRTFLTKQIRVLLRRTHPIILTLCFSSFLTALLTILNFSNWQFWFNSFLTILLVTLTLLHSDNKK
jgi:CRISPR/Cas system Type II protein with McrA/HNH and RuvC-like nuclease domain